MSYFALFSFMSVYWVGRQLILRRLHRHVTRETSIAWLVNTVSIRLVSTHLADDWFKLIAICAQLHSHFNLDVTCFSTVCPHFTIPFEFICAERRILGSLSCRSCEAENNFPVVTKLKCSKATDWLLKTSESNFVDNSIFWLSLSSSSSLLLNFIVSL